MKFFLGQMEMSREAGRVGTLALIRAVVGADGERPPQGDRAGARGPASGPLTAWPPPARRVGPECPDRGSEPCALRWEHGVLAPDCRGSARAVSSLRTLLGGRGVRALVASFPS